MKKICFFVLALLLSSFALADSPLFPFQKETDSVTFIDKKTQKKRSESTFTLTRHASNSEQNFELYRIGHGNFDKYKNITWQTNAQLKEKDGFLYLLKSSCTAKDFHGKTIVSYDKEFDYNKKLIYWRQLDDKGHIKKEAKFPIKGKTTDNLTLMYFLKAFVANRNKTGYQTCYLLSNEPKLYKVNIRVMGMETLQTPIGTKNAIKLKLTGEMGIVDDILDKYVPHTYVWYEKNPPHEWLQYEGLESSVQSANVIAVVTSRIKDPKE